MRNMLYFISLSLMLIITPLSLSATPLHEAARQGDVGEIERLLDAGAKIQARIERGYTALHEAARYGQTEAAIALLQAGANTEIKATGGMTPLHGAVLTGSYSTVTALLDFGANIEAVDSDGTTPLFLAAWFGQSKVAEKLLERGANIRARVSSAGDITPLHAAAGGSGQKETIFVFIESGADIEITSKFGLTPLHFAAMKGKSEGVAALLDAGANANAKMLQGVRPIDLANAFGMKKNLIYWRLNHASY